MGDEFNIDLPVLQSLYQVWYNINFDIIPPTLMYKDRRMAVRAFHMIKPFYNFFITRGVTPNKEVVDLIGDLKKQDFNNGLPAVLNKLDALWDLICQQIGRERWFRYLEETWKV